jgi:hypothetical protein
MRLVEILLFQIVLRPFYNSLTMFYSGFALVVSHSTTFGQNGIHANTQDHGTLTDSIFNGSDFNAHPFRFIISPG